MTEESSKARWPQRTGEGIRKWVRILWTLLTYPFVILFGIVGTLIGLFYGFWMGMTTKRGIAYGVKAGLLQGFIRGARIIFVGSSKLYKLLFFRSMYADGNVPLPVLGSDFLIIGHRGAPYCQIENTIGAFGQALKEGANALEIDVCITQDGDIVIWHDWDPDSTVAMFREGGLEENQAYRPVYPNGPMRRKVTDLTTRELRQHYGFVRKKDGKRAKMDTPRAMIPTLLEFFRWAHGQRELKAVFLDIKIPKGQAEIVSTMIPPIQEMVEEYDPHYEIVLVTPCRQVFEEMKRFAPDMAVSLDREVVSALPSGSAEAARAFSAVMEAEKYKNSHASVGRPTFLSLAPFEIYRSIILHDLRYREEKALPVILIAWTINERDELRELVGMGVDGILTDRPGRLANKVLGRKTREVWQSQRWLFRFGGEALRAKLQPKQEID